VQPKVAIPPSSSNYQPHLGDSVILPNVSYNAEVRVHWYGVYITSLIEFSHAVIYTRHDTDCPGVDHCCK